MKNAFYAVAFGLLCVLWLRGGELFGFGLATVFVLAGSFLLMVLGLGLDCLRLTWHGTLERLREGLKDPRDTLTHILMLAEHSRRNGLVGLAEVETNWGPLQRVCFLVASAADEQRIRVEAAASIDLARQRSNLIVAPWVFLAVALLGSAVLAALLTVSSGALSGGPLAPAHAFAPLLIAVLLSVMLVLPITLRLVMAREREISCIQLAYEGGLKILQNNNVDSVFHGLAGLVPGAPAVVTATDIGDLDTGRGPWQ